SDCRVRHCLNPSPPTHPPIVPHLSHHNPPAASRWWRRLVLTACCLLAQAVYGQDADRVRQSAPVTPAPPLQSQESIVLVERDADDADETLLTDSDLLESNMGLDSGVGGFDEPELDTPETVCGEDVLDTSPLDEAFAEQGTGNNTRNGSNWSGPKSVVKVRPRFGRNRQNKRKPRDGERPRLIRKSIYAAIGLPSAAMKFLPGIKTKGGGWYTDKWIAAGFYNNDHGLGGQMGNSPLRFNSLAEELALNQAWYHIRRAPNYEAPGFGWGFGFDVLFGNDAPDVQVGSSPLQITPDNEWDGTWDTSSRYGFAIPQMYLEGAWKCWSVKVGRFFAPFGYERVQAPQNFFYSHSYAFNYNQPLALWGLTIRKNWGTSLTTFSGRTTGWDTSLSNHDNEGQQTFFGFDYEPSPWCKLHGALSWGDPGDLADADTDFYFHEAYARFGVTNSLDYVLAHSFQTRTRPAGTVPINAFKMYGLANYLIWNLNDRVGLGARYEWFYSGEGANTALSPVVLTPGSHFHAITLGANVGVRGCFTIRPEVRYDWVDFDGPVAGPFDNATANSQFTYGVQTIFTW
ncbi:MAG: outer membrane beta-barrel protein, partial [Planctomycetota bacterium]